MEYRSKSEVVADALREQIRKGTLAPGATLRQRDVAEQFGVSPTPVREALRRLEAEGFVVTELHRGATVVRREEARLGENSLIRAALEPLAAQLAAERLTKQDLAELDELHRRLSQRRLKRDEAVELNRQFHFRIYQSAASPVLTSLLTVLWQSLDGGPQVQRSREESQAQHADILDALRHGDPKAAAELTRRHIETAMPKEHDRAVRGS